MKIWNFVAQTLSIKQSTTKLVGGHTRRLSVLVYLHRWTTMWWTNCRRWPIPSASNSIWNCRRRQFASRPLNVWALELRKPTWPRPMCLSMNTWLRTSGFDDDRSSLAIPSKLDASAAFLWLPFLLKMEDKSLNVVVSYLPIKKHNLYKLNQKTYRFKTKEYIGSTAQKKTNKCIFMECGFDTKCID